MDNMQSVQPIARFRHFLEDGRVVESQQPFPAEVAAVKKIYWAADHNLKMSRTDGKIIQFRNHYFEANMLHDQQYLDNEIFQGHERIRHASAAQEHEAKMMLRPKETMREVVELELRSKIEAELMERFGLKNPSQNASEAEKIAGALTARDKVEAALASSKVGNTGTATSDGQSAGVKVSEPQPVAGQNTFQGSVASTAQAAAAKLAASSGR